jgi:hypothetical protein
MDLGLHRPAGEIAPPGRGRGEADRGQQRVGGREPGRVVVDDDGDLARRLVEALLELQPQVLEPVEGALCEGGVGLLVAGGEAERISLDPGDAWMLRRR